MPTKTDHILSYLPGTFRALPNPTALYSVTDAFGNELLLAENSLAEIMRAHWVDHADRGAEFIDDLARIAALYGLSPRQPPFPEEEVEGFREHLKRYVRTFLDGTATVQGILRVTAEALGLRIADSYSAMDTWWTRLDDSLATIAPRGADAASLLFGIDAITVTGQPARAARAIGGIDLHGPIDLRGAATLRIKLDTAAPVDVDLAPHVANLGGASLGEIVAALAAVLGPGVASGAGGTLTLTSPTVGAASRLEVQEVAEDAAPGLLGLLPHEYHGATAVAARVTGTVDLGSGIDLAGAQYLRLLVDSAHLAEVDCAGSTTLDQIRAAINSALGIDVATHDDHFLTLTSPTLGSASSIAFQPPAAQDATARLFGQVASFHTGRDARPAEAQSVYDLGGGVDLSARSKMRIQLDNRSSVIVNCVGADPARTTASEIVAALNVALAPASAAYDGRFITLTSPTAGPDSQIIFEALPNGEDAADLIFGIGPRVFHGSSATHAILVGTPELGSGLWGRHIVRVALDGATPVEIDVRAKAGDPAEATLSEIVAAFDDVLGPGVAGADDQHLILTSPTTGSASQITIEPLALTCRRRFVSRAFVIDEAAQAIFGFVAQRAVGRAATQARVVGALDLSRGVDLRGARFLRISIDGGLSQEVDFATDPLIPRPRAAMLKEIVAAINQKFASPIASQDGVHLALVSPTTGVASQIALEPPRGADALDMLLGREPGTFRGSDATGVNFIGMADLSAGVDLSVADHVKIGVDGASPVEIACAGPDPAHTRLDHIVKALNLAVGVVIASHDGAHIILISPTVGADSRIEFVSPAESDATQAIFGITPRIYQGAPAAPARIVGEAPLGDVSNLGVARFLRLAVDSKPPIDVDCAALAADPTRVTRGEIIVAINARIGPAGSATFEGNRLAIAANARIDLLPYSDPASDARRQLLGDVEDTIAGIDPAPATITGAANLLSPVDLAERRMIRLSIDGGRRVDIDVSGVAPDMTFLDEIIARINAVFPGLAAATADDRLCLTSPTSGMSSRLELLPMRAIELIEYPPEPFEFPPRQVRHGDHWLVDNDGAADADLEVELIAPYGVAGPLLVNRSTGQRVRLRTIVAPGERAMLRRDPAGGLYATIVAADGVERLVPGSQILAGPLGAQAWVPFVGEWQLSGGAGNQPATLQLNNPIAPAIVVLRARRGGPDGGQIAVRAAEAALSGLGGGPVASDGQPARLVGRLRAATAGFQLTDASDATLAHLRAGPGIVLDEHRDHVVSVYGPLHSGNGVPLLVVGRIAELFDVTLRGPDGNGAVIEETYPGVAIGLGGPEDLAVTINTRPSQLVLAADEDKAAALTLPRGRSEFIYLDCYGARFDHALFDVGHFAGGLCQERGVFDISRFARTPPEPESAIFAASGPITDPPVEIRLRWSRHQPGAMVVNLPADLPEYFGGHFDQGRFGLAGETPEEFKGAVTEPASDDHFLIRLINDGLHTEEESIAPSTLVKAAPADRVPLGWAPATIPFRRPRARTLTGGTDGAPARIYLAEPDVPGFIELRATAPGAWGNSIAVSVHKSGPARFDVTVGYQGARFEIARQVALGGPLPALADDLLRPGPVGIIHAKAAGVDVAVTRDGIEPGC